MLQVLDFRDGAASKHQCEVRRYHVTVTKVVFAPKTLDKAGVSFTERGIRERVELAHKNLTIRLSCRA